MSHSEPGYSVKSVGSGGKWKDTEEEMDISKSIFFRNSRQITRVGKS